MRGDGHPADPGPSRPGRPASGPPLGSGTDHRRTRPVRLPARGWLWLVGAGALATLLVAAWPYSSLADLVTSGASLVDAHRPLRAALLDGGSLSCVYGAVALPALALRLRRDRLDPLVLTFALVAAVVAAIGGYPQVDRWPGGGLFCR